MQFSKRIKWSGLAYLNMRTALVAESLLSHKNVRSFLTTLYFIQLYTTQSSATWLKYLTIDIRTRLTENA